MFLTRPLATLTLILMLTLRTATAAAPGEEWVLEQYFDSNGKITVYIAANAVAIYNHESKYKAVVKAPDWKIHFFRPEQKTEWTGEIAKFNGKMLSDPMGNNSSNYSQLSAGTDGQMQGLKYIIYSNKSKANYYLWGASQINTAPQVTEFLCRYYDCPLTNKVPLFFCQTKVSNTPERKSVWLDTDVIRSNRTGTIIKFKTLSWKKTSYQVADFDQPKNYTQVGALTSISFSPTQKQIFTEALDGLGFTTEQGNNRKK